MVLPVYQFIKLPSRADIVEPVERQRLPQYNFYQYAIGRTGKGLCSRLTLLPRDRMAGPPKKSSDKSGAYRGLNVGQHPKEPSVAVKFR